MTVQDANLKKQLKAELDQVAETQNLESYLENLDTTISDLALTGMPTYDIAGAESIEAQTLEAIQDATSITTEILEMMSGTLGEINTFLLDIIEGIADMLQFLGDMLSTLDSIFGVLSGSGIGGIGESTEGTISGVIDPLGIGYGSSITGALGFADGGLLQGGSGTRDDLYLGNVGNNAIMAMGGEYIINKDSTNKIGVDILDYINDKGRLPMTFQNGGQVPSSNNLNANDSRIAILERANVEQISLLKKIYKLMLKQDVIGTPTYEVTAPQG